MAHKAGGAELSQYQTNRARYLGSISAICNIIRFGSTYLKHKTYSASQKNPPEIFWHFFPNGWEFSVQILHACYMFLSTLHSKFLFNYLQL